MDSTSNYSFWSLFAKIPSSSKKALKKSFSRESLPHWAWILGSSYVLYEYDAVLLEEVQRQGRDIGIGNKDNTKAFLRFKGINIFRGPTDAGSLMYFLGDGWLHAFIGTSFILRGGIANSSRAMNTGLAIFHGMGASAIFNQILKRSTGRESPNQRTKTLGAWRPFPSFKAYSANTAKYDAVPSGHVMTATLVLTVIQQNYPEYAYIVTPTGWTLITLLAWQMMNNGVHWASDYPLGIAMGVLFGRIAASQYSSTSPKHNSLQRKKIFHSTGKSYVLLPYSNEGGDLGLSWTWLL